MLGSMLRAVTAMAFVATGAAMAQQYSPGASDTEIRLGQTVPFSGPVSVAGVVGHASLAYFDAINKAGGINGRQVKLIVLDDAYSPPKTVEATRRLVEDDNVLMMYGSVGTPTNAAVEKYLNAKKVPHLFITTGASRFRDPKAFPWTMAFIPGYVQEGRAMAHYVLQSVAAPKIAVLYQNDDLGKDFRAGFRSGLGDKADSLIVSEQTYEVADPTVDSQLIAAKVSGANVFYFAGTQKAGAEEIRGVRKLDWKPLHLVCSIASNVEGVLKPAGLENAEGLISTAYAKDPFDPAWADDADVKAFLDWEKANLTQGNPRDSGVINGYVASFLMAHVLREAGSNLTRENVLAIATHLTNLRVPMLLPGITVTTTPSDYSVVNRFQIQRFESGRWVPVGETISGE
ncbi:MAG TPA: ABC transporter substrate-binding protein [Acetobacteraceae bacterium]|jgi:ABC-type branched-subunit amino acid transport system substrate-binding protein|nr:ABC transporter substrate-binding protein [Acetobacteraceae bacterium]